ncbi:hypothetical protein GI374_09095 [Paracoccus sp. S-4012]|uniref:hypothetical protein n=1 Tax=Paracoccus sp. S-4012 TaxID=2665648 RepID=UPI0012B0642C|nr:hypothetical protein [Paracoccus sp. S-4012]MRX50598.1 hypothetical protein [Paracoccus sp. S-4012]
MAESDDNLVLHLLREIRAEMSVMRRMQETHGERLTRIDRTLEELRDTAITAMGYSAHASLVTEKAGERFDLLTHEIDALKQRVAELESRP